MKFESFREFEPIQTEREREFMETRQVSAREICMLFGVPKRILSGPTNYSSVPRYSNTSTSVEPVKSPQTPKLLTYEG